ncbi:DUF3883 domain-containing protein [Vannielia sp.]|uniref:sacsin N-terminal ATP-binding-like domain-containing protein n=1 Tax=Vannielia sp. TaxID=2813045 RepID=UPI002607D702|nr:DUF3883 domain-containing protein [Vannielia sp.]MDF1871827.1 DUF3883 domain-containing protein [Vannielia sp.]
MADIAIDTIQTELFDEAIASPQLLADVAQLEGYISETYSNRSFVELLQNADDAGAKRFHVRLLEDGIVCANDGRLFTEADLRSICRSGSSTKTRGQTIGYRGIGFKSVAALSERVQIRSGAIAVIFDRDRTSRLTGLDREKVPLIRIPHHATPADVVKSLDIALDGMQTIFVFERIDMQRALGDLQSIGDDCLLFLRNIEDVTLDILGQKRSFRCRRLTRNGVHTLEIDTQGETRQWEVYPGSGVEFAFSKSGRQCVPLRNEEALVHAFLPSTEITGLGIRVNGDFSTDPSRTRIVLDDRTLRLIDEAAAKALEMMQRGLTGDAHKDLMSCLALNVDAAAIAFMKPCFGTELIKALRARADGCFDQVALRPTWLNATDFRKTAEAAGLEVLPKQITDEEDEALHQTMKMLGAKPADDNRLIEVLDPVRLSEQGRKDVIDHARKLQSLGAPQADKLLSLKGFAASEDGHAVSLREAIRSENRARPAAEFQSDPLVFAQVDDVLFHPAWQSEARRENTISVSRWRKGENVVAEIFRSQGYEVEDCSRQNLGYDLLAKNQEGDYFIEVKTINRAGEPFIMTSNEEAVAREKGNRYLVALQRELNDCVELAVIRDPANSLQLDRQWVWECSTYDYRPRRFPTK